MQAQQEPCHQWAARTGLAVKATHAERASGMDIERPELQSAIAALAPGDTVLVSSPSRLTRNAERLPAIVQKIEAKGAMLSIAEKGL